ncbi:MAG: hypothetical protein GY842_18765, partial [bacterium]|nr:hypothetical protein [bacterium]
MFAKERLCVAVVVLLCTVFLAGNPSPGFAAEPQEIKAARLTDAAGPARTPPATTGPPNTSSNLTSSAQAEDRTGAAEAMSPGSAESETCTVGQAVRVDSAPTIWELVERFPTHRVPTAEVEIPILVPDFLNDLTSVEIERDPLSRGFTGSQAPAALLSFGGYDSDDNLAVNGFRAAPPDTEGDVGKDYHVHYNNIGWKFFNKADGSLAGGPFPGNSFWAGFGGPCETNNNGDPIVLYDHVADQWVFSQFAITEDGHQCFAVSQPGAGPAGPYYRYDFLVTSNGVNDYPKIGVWTDGAGQSAYHMTTNEYGGGFRGVHATAFDRDSMLLGLPAAFHRFALASTGTPPERFSLQPSHLEGPVPPVGSCNMYVQAFDDQTWGDGNGPDGYQFWEFCVDFANPANDTFTPGPLVPTADFDAELCAFDHCVPQPGTAQMLDTLGEFTMYRFSNRYFPGTGLKGVLNHTVDLGGDLAGIRWVQFDLPSLAGVSIDDTGTLDVGDGLHRWMGSVALDAAGNMALGYSRSGTASFPSVYFTGRESADPAGTLQAESVCIDGSGSQLGTDRWGDYSTVSVDPVDNCTFWLTNEYVEVTGTFEWDTQICSFRFPSCGADCNSNGISDDIDIAGGTSEDCQPDSVPDECQIAAGPGPGPCTAPDATITIDILTDSYQGETTWELAEEGVGVVASGGPYVSSGVHYVVDVDVCSTSCYTFTIFDAYGDGISAPGGYEISFNGGVVASTMGNGWGGTKETVTDIGGGCPYFPGSADCQPDSVPDECQFEAAGVCDEIVYDAGECDGLDGVRPSAGWSDAGMLDSFAVPQNDGPTRFSCFHVEILDFAQTDMNTMRLRVYELPTGSIPVDLPSFAAATPVFDYTYTAASGELVISTRPECYPGAGAWDYDVAGPAFDLAPGDYALLVNFPGNGAVNYWASAADDGFGFSYVWGAQVDAPSVASMPVAWRLMGGGTGNDCNDNGVPDECDLECNDCNLNLIPDDCDIARGTSEDADSSGIPDECEERAHPGWGSEGFK